ncbi:MAG: 50S ribosomal protein L2 [bacterium]
MTIKTFVPYTPSRRTITVEDFSNLTKIKAEKSLLKPLHKRGGRNNSGQIMVRHIGGGHKRQFRQIDFKRDKHGIPGRVISIEYDPNRTARIALVHYADGEKRYIIHPQGLQVGDKVHSGKDAEIKVGNALPLSHIPIGTIIHNIEFEPGCGAKMIRSAGAQAQLMAIENGFANIKLTSREIRLVPDACYATIGQVGNMEHENVVYGNAGRNRHRGIRPTVRGTAMNSVDHPHGGGRGRSKGANHPRSPWNQPAKGFKTRKKKIYDYLIIKRRATGKDKG